MTDMCKNCGAVLYEDNTENNILCIDCDFYFGDEE